MHRITIEATHDPLPPVEFTFASYPQLLWGIIRISWSILTTYRPVGKIGHIGRPFDADSMYIFAEQGEENLLLLHIKIT